MRQHGPDIGGFEGAVEAAVGEEVGRRRCQGEAVDVVVGAVGRYVGGPELELAGAGCGVGLKGVEWRECGVNWGREG